MGIRGPICVPIQLFLLQSVARFGDRKDRAEVPAVTLRLRRPCHFTSRVSLVTRIDLAIGSLTVWTGEDNLLCDTTKIASRNKKLAADGEVAYCERALGVNVGLNPRKRIGIIQRRLL